MTLPEMDRRAVSRLVNSLVDVKRAGAVLRASEDGVRDLKPPFQFDLSTLIQQARRTFQKRVKGVSVSLPFVRFSVRPDDRERRVAREIVIRMADRRVLNAVECCDGCIDQALASLQEIRSLLVDKLVDLADLTDGAL